MNKRIIITASLLGVLAVVTGAFGAHGLKAVITTAQLETWHTAVQYNFYHVFALLFLSTFGRFKNNMIVAAYYFFTFGVVLFSGSLYLMACKDLLGLNAGFVKVIGPITPIGGLLYISGWIMLAFAALRHK
jgi:uncharacterized membrane protein YgdD (TMEM256/DUF423 family)